MNISPLFPPFPRPLAMRAAFLTTGPLEQVSGSFLYDRRLTAYLARQGDEVNVISLPRRSYLAGVLDNSTGKLEEMLLSSPPDILVEDAQGHPVFAGLNERLKKRRPFPVIALIHHMRSRNIRYLRSADGFIFNNAYAEKEVSNLLGRPILSLVAPPGRDGLSAVAVEQKTDHREDDPQTIVIFVGSVIRRRGLHVLIEALSRLREIDWQLRVVGDLWMERAYVNDIRARISGSGIAGRIRFYGRVPETKLCDLLRCAHLLAVPTLEDNSGLCYLDAMGFGLPVIASRSCGAESMVTDGKEGFLTQPDDPAVIALRVWQLARDPAMRQTMSGHASRRFLQHPSWDESCSAIRNFLCGVTNAAGRVYACSAPSIDGT